MILPPTTEQIHVISATGIITGYSPSFKNFWFWSKKYYYLYWLSVWWNKGARMIVGERKVKMFGKMIHIRAQIRVFSNTSAHEDSNEILLITW